MSPVRIRLDGACFPIVQCSELNIEVGLLPVTRVQFEYFLGDISGFSTTAYEEICRTSPRGSWRTFPHNQPERVFMTAVRPDEIDGYTRWLGNGFRIPTEAEWRAVDAAIGVAGPDLDQPERVAADSRLHPAARAILQWSLGRQKPATWRTVGLFDRGLLEWVSRPGGYGLHGRPPSSLIRLVHNPQVHPAVEPTTGARHPAFGFRLVRPWPPNPTASR